MDPSSKKRLRSSDSPASDSEDKQLRSLPESPRHSKTKRSLQPPFPKLPVADSSDHSLKKPKLWDYDHKKPSSSIHSGMFHCIRQIQDSIKTNDYESLLSSLRKLSSELTMSSEEQLAMLPLDHLTDSIIYSLNIPDYPEIALQSIICLNYLLEANHSAIISFVKAGVISQLTSRLMSIEYIDVAEFAVKALEKISAEFPTEVLREGFLNEIFGVLDFFEQNVQKRVLGIVLNISRAIPGQEDFLNYVLPSVTSVIGLLYNRGRDFQHQNEKAIEILIGLNESMRVIGTEEALSSIVIEQKLIPLLFTAIHDNSTLIIKALKLFSVMCRNSLHLTAEFIQDGVLVIRNIVEKGIAEGSCLIVTESLQLINSIIPNDHDPSALRLQYFSENLQSLHQITDIVIPRISAIYELLIKKNAKILFLDTIHNLLSYSSPSVISQYPQYSQFLSNLLVEKESSILKGALQIVNILYDQIPEVISTSFIRGGVVQRFKALKHPENLKNISEDKYSDPLEFEHFLVNYRRSRAYSEHQELTPLQMRPRMLSECRDSNYDQKKEIIALSKAIIDKHSNCHNHSAQTVVKSLKNLAIELESNTSDSADRIWEDFGQILDDFNPTAFEFSSSLLADCIWKWLTFRVDGVLSIARYHNFVYFISQHCKSGQLYFAKVLLLFMNTFGYVETLSSVGIEKHGNSRNPQQKTRIYMQYAPAEEITSELQTRHEFFAAAGKFSVSPDPACPVGLLKAMLARVENKDDLGFFKEAIKDEPMEMEEDQAANNIKICMLVNDRELTDDVLAGDILLSSSETRVVKFQYSNTGSATQYLSSHHKIYEEFLETCSRVGLPEDLPAYPYLRFIKFLFSLSFHSPFISTGIQDTILLQSLSNYISPKLNSIAFKQFQEPISLSRRNLPQWLRDLPKLSWFLFAYSTRLKILDNFRFVQSESYRLPRQKIKIDRENILQGAMMILNDTALLQQGILEIQYDNEIGTGNGPTLEFFTLLSQAIRKLEIWRNSTMLFPAPHQIHGAEYFNFIGKVVGKSIIDRRYVELPLSPVFWKLVLKQTITIKDLRIVDPDLFRTIGEMQELVRQHSLDPSIATYKDCSFEDLCLFFTLPGHVTVELVPEGRHIAVTLSNLQEYTELVVKHTLLQAPQATAFREGLGSLIPIETLLGFSAEELEEIVCGSSGEVWDMDTLRASIKPAHGYSDTSSTFQNLLKIMTEFTMPQQKKFLQFATGCPRLPLGGFFGLVPCLTVVRKEEGDDPDKYLPSVMTCQNYLKIPNYSSDTVLRKNLNLALEEGYQAFHLS